MGQVAGSNVVSLRKGLQMTLNKEVETYNGISDLISPLVTVIPTDTLKDEFGWVAQLPEMYEFKGARELKGLNDYYYSIENKVYSVDVQISKDTYNDDQYNMWATKIKELAGQAKRLDITKFLDLLNQGETLKGIDGVAQFSTQHIWKGYQTVQSNLITGSGVATSADIKVDLYKGIGALDTYRGDLGQIISSTSQQRELTIVAPSQLRAVMDEMLLANQIGNTTNIVKGIAKIIYLTGLNDANDWYLIDTMGAVKPFIKTNRENPKLVAMDRDTDYNVYFNRMYIYSVETRFGMGFGPWWRAVKIKNA